MNVAADQQFPAKWPFPPTPPSSFAASLLQGRPFAWARRRSRQRVDRFAHLHDVRAKQGVGMTGQAAMPAELRRGPQSESLAPSLPTSVAASLPASLHASVAGTASAATDVSLRQMVVDVLLVAMWGAMIPLFMWLGSAAGF
jgi:hypothetical protein